MFKRRKDSIHDGDGTRPDMAHVLSAGLEFLEHSNPNGNPCVKGYNIINGELKQASDGATFKSTNPAWLDDCLGEFPLSNEAIQSQIMIAFIGYIQMDYDEVDEMGTYSCIEAFPNSDLWLNPVDGDSYYSTFIIIGDVLTVSIDDDNLYDDCTITFTKTEDD